VAANWIKNFRRFWTAEEVPRWFGLSLVTVYLLGLGAATHLGIAEARKRTKAVHQQSTDEGLRLLAERLEGVSSFQSIHSSGHQAAYQRALRDVALRYPVWRLRVVDDQGKVIASTVADEIGSIRSEPGAELSPGDGFESGVLRLPGLDDPQRFIRVPMHVLESAPGHDSSARHASAGGEGQVATPAVDHPMLAAASFLEAVYPLEPPGSPDLASYASVLVTVLVVCGILFALYRALRKQMRVASQIVDRLQTTGKSIAGDLVSLQLADEVDAAGKAWNKLIQLTAELQEEVNRTRANGELAKAFQQVGGGALAHALNAVADGIIHITPDCRFDYMNNTAMRLFGWDEEKTKQASVSEAQAGGMGGTLLETIRDAQRPDNTFDSLNKILEIRETDSTYRIWITPLKGARYEGSCVVVIRDVSQQMRADKVREEFVTQVTHELRTPLTNIRAYAETLSSGMFDDPKVVTECYNVINKETRRLSRLIEDVLSVSQMEVGSMELHVDALDLRTLLSDAVRDVRGLADDKNIDLQLVLPSKMESVQGDRDKLAVVMNNILGNAIKYTPAGGSVVVGCQISSEEVSVTFKDNGIGIDESDHSRVFDKFQRAQDPDVQNETGSGIGLYTAREIVRRHGGNIDLVSKKGEGATFIVRLPHTESRAKALTVSAEA
jgi:two-component system phosphate regulon sensor histidine kinase PhoR